jgi:hypothetical protein
MWSENYIQQYPGMTRTFRSDVIQGKSLGPQMTSELQHPTPYNYTERNFVLVIMPPARTQADALQPGYFLMVASAPTDQVDHYMPALNEILNSVSYR